MHILVGMHDDADAEPVDHALVERVAAEAWIAQADRLVEYVEERPHLGIPWTRDGIAGVDHTDLPAFSCSGFFGGAQPVIVGHP